MVSPLAGTASLLLVCAACVSSHSASPASRCPIDHPGHVRLDLPGRGLTDVPLDAIAMPVGQAPGLAELCAHATRSLSIPGVYHGSSGAPVFFGDELVGGISLTQEYQQSDLGLGFRPIATIREWSRIGNAWSADAPRGPAMATDPPRVEPGMAVRFLTIWGDLESSAQGTVTDRDGNTLSLLSHATDYRPDGVRHALLQQAEPLEIESSWWHGRKDDAHRTHSLISGAGPTVGRVNFESKHGLVGDVGTLPPHFRVVVRIATEEEPVLELAVCVAANGERSLDRYTLEDALGPFVPADFEANLERRVGEGRDYAWLSSDEARGEPEWEVLREHDDLSGTLQELFRQAGPGDEFRLRVEGPAIARTEIDPWRQWR